MPGFTMHNYIQNLIFFKKESLNNFAFMLSTQGMPENLVTFLIFSFSLYY